jgi:hypothetical protein
VRDEYDGQVKRGIESIRNKALSSCSEASLHFPLLARCHTMQPMLAVTWLITGFLVVDFRNKKQRLVEILLIALTVK